MSGTEIVLAAGLLKSAVAAFAKAKLKVVLDAHDNTRAFREADLATLNDAHYEAIERQAQALAALKQANVDVEAALNALLRDHQFRRVQDNYVFETVREPMDERKRMLQYASAGSYNVELSLAQIARVERIVRELDPGEVLWFADAADSADEVTGHIDAMYYGDARFEALIAAGCVRPPLGDLWDDTPYVVTANGRNLLAIVRGYVNARREPAAQPNAS